MSVAGILMLYSNYLDQKPNQNKESDLNFVIPYKLNECYFLKTIVYRYCSI